MSSREEIRLKLDLHYDGSGFYGWQIQPEHRTVQGVLQAAAERLTQSPRTMTGAGRTDRGVHATGQVASLRVPATWSATDFRDAMNAVLPDDVWVERARRVNLDFHPRYDAVARTYRYRVGTTDDARSPFHRPFCWPLDEPADPELLRRAARQIPGERSFEAFAKKGQPERGTRCHVRAAEWREWPDRGLVFSITANRYLHHMVRYLVGTMVRVASGRRPLEDLTRLLDRGPDEDRWTSPPAPPRGLFLHRVEYPEGALRVESRHQGDASDTPNDDSTEPSTLVES